MHKKLVLAGLLCLHLSHGQTLYEQPFTQAHLSASEKNLTGTLIFPVLFGCASGYLCRAFDEVILKDLLLLRLINLYVWGKAEQSIINDYINSLKEQQSVPNTVAIQNTARIFSWLCYVMK